MDKTGKADSPMNMSNQEYNQYVSGKAKKSPLWKDCLWAFCVGGLICVIGQLLRNWYQSFGIPEEDAGTLMSCSLIFLSALLTGLGWFDNIAKRAGAGTVVPITGFANAMVSPALEFKSEGFVLGVAAKMFTIAGPVIVYGTVASVLYGVIEWIIQLF